jgi:chromate reductase, NAD(P)H dehydrogenase (quinone)
MKRIVALSGSLRRGSYNRLLLQAAIDRAPDGMELVVSTEMLDIPVFNEDLEKGEARGPEAVARLADRIAKADGLLIATPEYNQSIPGAVKNMIDWLSRPVGNEVLEGKPVSIIGATTGPWGARLAQSLLRHTLTATGALVLPQPQLYVAGAELLFGPDGRLLDEAVAIRLAKVLSAFGRWIDLVTPEPSVV